MKILHARINKYYYLLNNTIPSATPVTDLICAEKYPKVWEENEGLYYIMVCHCDKLTNYYMAIIIRNIIKLFEYYFQVQLHSATSSHIYLGQQISKQHDPQRECHCQPLPKIQIFQLQSDCISIDFMIIIIS